MSANADLLRALSGVYIAGATKASGWIMNNDAQILAATLRAMSDEAEQQATRLDREEAARHD